MHAYRLDSERAEVSEQGRWWCWPRLLAHPGAAVALGSLLAGQRSSLLPEPWGRSLVGPGPVRSVPSLPVLWCGLLTGMPGSRHRLPLSSHGRC